MISVVCLLEQTEVMQQVSVLWVEIPRKYSVKLLNLADDCFLAEGKRKNKT